MTAFGAPFPFGFTVTVKRPGGRNEFGDRLPGTEYTIDGCAWSPRMREAFELEDATRATVVEGLQLYGPPQSGIEADDVVVLPPVLDLVGKPEKRRTYRVVGEIGEWFNPLTGWYPGFEVALERVS